MSAAGLWTAAVEQRRNLLRRRRPATDYLECAVRIEQPISDCAAGFLNCACERGNVTDKIVADQNAEFLVRVFGFKLAKFHRRNMLAGGMLPEDGPFRNVNGARASLPASSAKREPWSERATYAQCGQGCPRSIRLLHTFGAVGGRANVDVRIASGRVSVTGLDRTRKFLNRV